MGVVAWIVCWRMVLIMSVAFVCGSCVCSGDSSRTVGMDCVGGCFYYYVVFCCLMCAAAVCA